MSIEQQSRFRTIVIGELRYVHILDRIAFD
jgi:hypothetical protein